MRLLRQAFVDPLLLGNNWCVNSGTSIPVQALSGFCPVTCGCRRGDYQCPDSCPAPGENEVMPTGRGATNPLWYATTGAQIAAGYATQTAASD